MNDILNRDNAPAEVYLSAAVGEALQAHRNEIKEIVLEVLNQQQLTKEPLQEGLITPREARKILNASDVTLWRWRKEGYLPAIKIGSRYYYRREDVAQLMRRGGQPYEY